MIKTAVFIFAIFFAATLVPAQCTKDVDCKGDRICVNGECVERTITQNSSTSSEAEPAPIQSSTKKRKSFGPFNLYLNPLGFVEFGPIVGGQVIIAPRTYLDFHWRYSKLGLLYNVITNGFVDEVGVGSMAYGGGITHFIPIGNTPNCMYVGLLYEYGFGTTHGGSKSDTWDAKNAQSIIACNPGFRFRIGSTAFLNLGLQAGVSIPMVDQWWYVDEPSHIKYNDDKMGPLFFGGLEFSLGLEFGRGK